MSSMEWQAWLRPFALMFFYANRCTNSANVYVNCINTNYYKRKMIKYWKKWTLVLAIAAGSMFSYSFIEDINYFEMSKNLDIFATLFKELNIYYVEPTDPNKLMKKGIDAMLESLDPYTDFYPESEIEDYRMMTTGQYGGIGAAVRQRGDYVMIAEPYEGYPANKADLRAGDLILEIDGKSIKGKRYDEVSKILKGQANTNVKLLIKRDGEAKPLEKVLAREDVKIKSVPYYGMLPGNIAYIKLTGFTENAGNEVKDAYLALKNQGVINGVILDLRDNPGGLLNEAVNISNIFVEKGQDVVDTRGKVKEWDKSYKAINAPVDLSTPLVVMVNSGSASASEIVSGALQDLDRAVIVGQRTFGKGLVQTTRPLTYNTQLKVTTAKYYIPSGRCIQALDYSHRNADGSVGKVPDSLMTAFKTHNGRLVYDGGGVIPDIKSQAPTASNITISLLSKFIIFDYATKYKREHASIPNASNFNLNESDYQDFLNFIADKDYDYVSDSEKILEKLKETALKEKSYAEVKDEIEALKTRLHHNKKEDLAKNKQEIMNLLKEEIASRYYLQVGRVQAELSDDQEVLKAIETLNNKERYASVLNGKYQDPEVKEYLPKKK